MSRLIKIISLIDETSYDGKRIARAVKNLNQPIENMELIIIAIMIRLLKYETAQKMLSENGFLLDERRYILNLYEEMQ